MANRLHPAGVVAMLAAVGLVTTACGGTGSGGDSKAMTLYTCASANVEQAVVTAFERAHPGTTVNVFRAATGHYLLACALI